MFVMKKYWQRLVIQTLVLKKNYFKSFFIDTRKHDFTMRKAKKCRSTLNFVGLQLLERREPCIFFRILPKVFHKECSRVLA